MGFGTKIDPEINNGAHDGPKGMEKVIAVLTAGHLDSVGGYPYDYEVYKGRVFIATLDPAKEYACTLLNVYSVEELREWEKLSRAYREEYPSATWMEAVSETA